MEITRTEIENYFHEKWSDLVDRDTLLYLIEQACKEYKIVKQRIPGYDDEKLKPLDLGEV